SGDPGWRELVGRLRNAALDAFEHQALPFARLVEELATERSPSHAPLVQVVFAFQAEVADFALPGVATQAERLAGSTAHFRPPLLLCRPGRRRPRGPRIRPRPLRSHDRPAPGRGLRPALGRRKGGARPAALGPAAPRRGRAPPDADGVERHPPPVPGAGD